MARVLVVDDDPAVGLTLSRMLGLEGHEVTRVDSAAAGLEQVRRAPPEAVILDMRMPVMGGLDFLRRLRQSGPSRLPVGIVTGDYFLEEAVLAELGRLGAEVRYKPVGMDDLSSLMNTLLGRGGGPAA
jgi:CheY-like chemotaxis protein